MGYCMDISAFKSDSKIVSTISKFDEATGMQKVSTESYSPVEEENRLSKREIEVLKWLMTGMSSQTISEKLHLSTHPVNTHRRNMLEKANAKNTADLIRFALQQGLV
jgi:DNA-binding CsgD family transcriptional regulator